MYIYKSFYFLFIQFPLFKFKIFHYYLKYFQLLFKSFLMSYDSAITVFSPNGHLFQVQYAIEAVKRGMCSVGVVGSDSIILAVQKKSVTKLQQPRTVKKIVQLDTHIYMAFSGLTADGRILANKARVQCQSFRLNYDDAPPVEYIAKFIAQTKQKYTQKGGVRPFGLSTLIAGFDINGIPHLYSTDPSGSFSEWKANSVGRNSKQVNEYLQKHYKQESSFEQSMKLAAKALMDVVESGNKNIELLVMKRNEVRILSEAQIEQLVLNLKE